MLKESDNVIDVKNADGDIDTTATIVVQNKIDYIPKISVIIPVYNVEQYLRECLDSVINQTLKEIEIICVDDGSTDKSLEILKEYAQKDNRITVITQENLHAGVARNAGLAIAKGEYVHFLDSDDWVDLDTYEKLYDIAKKHPTKVIKFCSYCFDNKTKSLVNSFFTRMGAVQDDKFNKNLGLKKDIDTLVDVSDAPWSGLYDRQFLNSKSIRFDNLLCANDVSFFYRCIINTDYIYMVNRTERFVYYRINNSTSLIGIRAYNFDCQINQFVNINRIIKNCDKNHIDVIRKHLINSVFFRYSSYMNNSLLELDAKRKIFIQMKSFIKTISPEEVPQTYKYHYYALLTDICVSVIIPVYNSELYLRECLDSIINQSLYNIEIICINDGSTDNSLKILQEYADKDERIKIINNEKNSGAPGVVKNLGIAVAKGEYIGFVDSDDWVDKDFFFELYNTAKQNNADMASGLKITRFNSEQEWASTCDVHGLNILTTIDEKKPLIQKAGSNCIKLYKTDFVRKNNLKCWEQRSVSEDNYLSMTSMLLADKIAINDKVVYHYRKDVQSVTNHVRTNSDFNMFDVYVAIDNYIKSLSIPESEKNNMLDAVNARKTQDFTWFKNDIDRIYIDEFKHKLKNIFPDIYSNIFEDKELIISLTSYPARIGTVNQTIESLLNQSMKADRVILWLASEQFPNREADLPQQLLDLRDKGLEIDWYHDIRSYKKLIPTLKKYPDAIVVTADDDLVFASNWLECLYNGYQKHPDDISIHRASKFYHDKYGWHVIPGGMEFYEDGSPLNKICSGAGAIYPPHCFYKDMLNEDLFLKLAPTNDDQWIWVQAILNSKKIYVVENNQPNLTYVPDTQETGLSKINDHGQKLFWKDFNRLVEYYPQAKEILLNEAKTHKINKKFVVPYRAELEAWYNRVCGPINLDRPRTFNEKIQWSKIYDSTPIKTKLADKYLVRDWVANKIGDKYLIPLLGVYDSFEEIDFEKLPNQFVIKCNHGCAYNIIVKDKSKLDLAEVKEKLDKWMSENFAFKNGSELHYRDIEPKITIEKYIENKNSGGDLYDYKFWCFGGKVYYIQFLSERNIDGLKMAFYDKKWHKQNFTYDHPLDKKTIPCPDNLQEMIKLAETLSKDFNHVRVDFYRLDDGTIYFGEMTFTSASGKCGWSNEKYNRFFGHLIKLPKFAYNIDTGTYYKPPKASKGFLIKPYLLFPYYLIKLIKLRHSYKKAYTREVFNQIKTYRIDIRHTDDKGTVDVIEKNINYQKPTWMKGNGITVINNTKRFCFNIQCSKSGIVFFSFMGMDRRANDKRIPVYVKYKSIKIDGTEILNAPIEVWHDKPFKYTYNVTDKQQIKIEVETEKYIYNTQQELETLLSKLYPNQHFSNKILKRYINSTKYSKIKYLPEIQSDAFIPLGPACQPAHRLKQANLRQFALPFDWMMNYDLDFVIETLKSKKLNWFTYFTEEASVLTNRRVKDNVSGMVSLYHFPKEYSVKDYLPVFYGIFNRRNDRFKKILTTKQNICFVANRSDSVAAILKFMNDIMELYNIRFLTFINIRHSDTDKRTYYKYKPNDRCVLYDIYANNINENGDDNKTNPDVWKGNTQLWNRITSKLKLNNSDEDQDNEGTNLDEILATINLQQNTFKSEYNKLLQQMNDSWSKQHQETMNKQNELSNQIKTWFAEHKNIINSVQNDLYQKLNSVKSEYVDSLNTTKDELNKKIDFMETNQQNVSKDMRDKLSEQINSIQNDLLSQTNSIRDNQIQIMYDVQNETNSKIAMLSSQQQYETDKLRRDLMGYMDNMNSSQKESLDYMQNEINNQIDTMVSYNHATNELLQRKLTEQIKESESNQFDIIEMVNRELSDKIASIEDKTILKLDAVSSEYTDSLNVTKDELNNKIDCIEVNQQIISNNIRDEISDKITLCSIENKDAVDRVKNDLSQKLNDMKSEYKEDITNIKQGISDQINDISDDLSNNINTLSVEHKDALDAIQRDILNRLKTIESDNKITINNIQHELSDKIDSVKFYQNNTIESVQCDLSSKIQNMSHEQKDSLIKVRRELSEQINTLEYNGKDTVNSLRHELSDKIDSVAFDNKNAINITQRELKAKIDDNATDFKRNLDNIYNELSEILSTRLTNIENTQNELDTKFDIATEQTYEDLNKIKSEFDSVSQQNEKRYDSIQQLLTNLYTAKTNGEQDKLEFRTFGNLAYCIRSNLYKIPEDIDMVVGVPRSGMIPAYIIALFMNKKCCSLDEFISGIKSSNGFRNVSNKPIKNILVVDDSIFSGTEMSRVREKLSGFTDYNFKYMAVYARTESKDKVDVYLEIVDGRRVWQWNYLNHSIAGVACFDMDGVLCVDPTDDQNDDGDKYVDFIKNAKPLYIPKYKIRAIVTCRLEKYRKFTEEWLAENGVKYDELIMLDLPSAAERRKLGCHADFKAEVYKRMTDTKIFIESDPYQAKQIATATGKQVLCVKTDELF